MVIPWWKTAGFDWQAGDAVYIPVWAWHHHVNLDDNNPAKYLACENAPMLQNMGRLAIREEAEEKPHAESTGYKRS